MALYNVWPMLPFKGSAVLQTEDILASPSKTDIMLTQTQSVKSASALQGIAPPACIKSLYVDTISLHAFAHSEQH